MKLKQRLFAFQCSGSVLMLDRIAAISKKILGEKSMLQNSDIVIRDPPAPPSGQCSVGRNPEKRRAGNAAAQPIKMLLFCLPTEFDSVI